MKINKNERPKYCKELMDKINITEKDLSPDINPYLPLDENIYFNFGKYKGLKIEDIKKTNPSYINWVYENTNDIKLKTTLESIITHK